MSFQRNLFVSLSNYFPERDSKIQESVFGTFKLKVFTINLVCRESLPIIIRNDKFVLETIAAATSIFFL